MVAKDLGVKPKFWYVNKTDSLYNAISLMIKMGITSVPMLDTN